MAVFTLSVVRNRLNRSEFASSTLFFRLYAFGFYALNAPENMRFKAVSSLRIDRGGAVGDEVVRMVQTA
jgi:hypothetical protein